MALLVVKLVLAPLLVIASTLAGRRWGDRLAGMLVAFPVVAGPILLIVTLEHGARFGARAAASSLLGPVALAVFAVVFASASRRWPWPAVLAVSWGAATIGVDVVLSRVAVGAGWALLAVLAAVWLAGRAVAGWRTAARGRGLARR